VALLKPRNERGAESSRDAKWQYPGPEKRTLAGESGKYAYCHGGREERAQAKISQGKSLDCTHTFLPVVAKLLARSGVIN
jgi:hypothetical protein